MSFGLRLLAGVVLAGASSFALCTPSVEHEAAALFGLEYDDILPGAPIRPGSLSCIESEVRTIRSAGQTRDDWQVGIADCRGRHVELLKRRTEGGDGATPRWRVEDVLLLPAFPANGSRYLGREDRCVLVDAAATSVVALLRRREGRAPTVEQLWTYDLEAGRMERQPVTRVECSAEE